MLGICLLNNNLVNNDIFNEFIDEFFETYHINYKYGIPLLIIIIVGLSIILAVRTVNKLFEKPNTKKMRKKNSEQQLIQYDPEVDANMFQDYVFNSYVKICKCWTDNDYDGLKKYLSSDLYNTFCEELSVLKQNSQKNIINNIKYIHSVINNIRKENDSEFVEVILIIELNSYTVDSSNNVIDGDKDILKKETYLLTFQKALNDENVDWVLDRKKIMKQEALV